MKKTRKIAAFALALLFLVSSLGLQMTVSAEDDSVNLQGSGYISTKKGSGIGGYRTNCGINYVFNNMWLDDALSSSDCGHGYATDGTHNYYYKDDYTNYYTSYASQGVSVVVQLMMGWTNDSVLQNLIFPSGRASGHSDYALNTSTTESRNLLTQIFQHFVSSMPQVNCWIIGNEINYEGVWNYCGSTRLTDNIIIAAQSFDCMYSAIENCGSGAKAAISLDMCWNPSSMNADWFRSKDFLTAFANLEKSSGRNWYLAFHPYPVPYSSDNGDVPSEWCLWSRNCSPYQTFDYNTPFITAANLYLLTDYIRANWGSSHHVLLTEFGYDYRQGETAQAAELYYTYKAAERNSMIDACIYQWMESQDAGDGRDMGMLNANGTPRAIYNVFKYMNTDAASANESYYKSYLSSVTGTSFTNWQQNISYGTGGSLQPGEPSPINTTPPANAVSDIASGTTYTMIPKNNTDLALDAYAGGITNGTRLWLYPQNGTEAQKFTLILNSDGSWQFENEKCELSIDVSCNSPDNGAAVQLYDCNYTNAQKWKFQKNSDGTFTILNFVTGKAIDVPGGAAKTGQMMQMYDNNGTGAQRYYLVEATSGDHTWDGTYTICSSLDQNKVIDVSAGSSASGANIQVWTSNGTDAQKFRFIYSGNNYYRIINIKSLKAMDVYGGTPGDWVNIWQYEYNGSDAQLWSIRSNGDGTVSFFNKKGAVLDVAGASTADGANIQTYHDNGTGAQKWILK